MDGPAPAIANAIAHATGADIRRLPLTPEAIASLLGALDAPERSPVLPRDGGFAAANPLTVALGEGEAVG